MSRISPAKAYELRKGMNKIVGANLRAMRLQADLSQEKVGDILGMTFQQVQKYENGNNRIAVSTAAYLCQKIQSDPLLLFAGLDIVTAPDVALQFKPRDLELAAVLNQMDGDQRQVLRGLLRSWDFDPLEL